MSDGRGSWKAAERPSVLSALPPLGEEVDHGERASVDVFGGGCVRRGDDRTGADFLTAGVECAQETAHGLQAGPVSRVDERDLYSQFRGEQSYIHAASAPLEFVGHRQDHQGRQSQAQHRIGQHQVRLETGPVQNKDHGLRLPVALQPARQEIAGDLLVQAARRQTVDAGKVNDLHRTDSFDNDSRPALYGHARVVGHLLTQSGETVEERRLAGIGWSHQCDARMIRARRRPLEPARWMPTVPRCSIRVENPSGLECAAHAEAGRGLPPQGDQVAVHTIDGRPPSGRMPHGTDLAARYDATLQQRLDILAGHLHPDDDDLLFQGHVCQRSVGRFRG